MPTLSPSIAAGIDTGVSMIFGIDPINPAERASLRSNIAINILKYAIDAIKMSCPITKFILDILCLILTIVMYLIKIFENGIPNLIEMGKRLLENLGNALVSGFAKKIGLGDFFSGLLGGSQGGGGDGGDDDIKTGEPNLKNLFKGLHCISTH